jgi:predicted patatin/cPLA2 family phospholipase
VVCTNVETGKPEYIRMTDMRAQIDLLRASASLPYASSIVEADGMKLLDGGCTDSIPVEKFREMGYARNVVVLTRPEDYRKKHDSGLFAKLFYRKYPAFADTLVNRDIMYNGTVERIRELEQDGSVFVIRPKHALNIGRLERDKAKVRQVYDIGRADALECLEQLKNWLSE